MSIEVGSIVYVRNPAYNKVSPAFVHSIEGDFYTILFYTGEYSNASREVLGIWPDLTVDLIDKRVQPCPDDFFNDSPAAEAVALATFAKLSSSSSNGSDSTDFEQSIAAPGSIAEASAVSKLELSTSLIEDALPRRRYSTLRRLSRKARQHKPGTKKAPIGQPIKPAPRQKCCAIQ